MQKSITNHFGYVSTDSHGDRLSLDTRYLVFPCFIIPTNAKAVNAREGLHIMNCTY